jgi:hypothetical protein
VRCRGRVRVRLCDQYVPAKCYVSGAKLTKTKADSSSYIKVEDSPESSVLNTGRSFKLDNDHLFNGLSSHQLRAVRQQLWAEIDAIENVLKKQSS